MKEKLKYIDKVYRRCFILTDHKLRRIAQIARQVIEKTTTNLSEKYLISLADGKELYLDNLEQVLAQDNSQKNPITRMRCEFSADPETEISNKIIIIYNRENNSYEGNIHIVAGSTELSWIKEAISAIEEQVERTIATDMAYSINRKPENIFALLMFLFAIGAAILFSKQPLNFFPSVQTESLKGLIEIGNEAKTDSEKINFLHRYAMATLEKPIQQKMEKSSENKGKKLLMAIPFLVWLALIILILFKFYPRNIFSWGDIGDIYNKKMETRKNLWWGVIIAFGVSIMSSVLMLGINI